jgi:hypothetical protein
VLILLLVLPALLVLSKWIFQGIRLKFTFSGSSALGTLSLLFLLLYPLSLLASLTFFDASTRLNDRILAPLYLVLLIALAIFFSHWLEISKGWQQVLVGLAALGLVFIPYSAQTWAEAQSSRQYGLGFNSRSWQSSDTVEAVSRLPADSIIYSNEAFPLNYLSGRDVYPAPEKIDPVLAIEREDYQGQLGTMRHLMGKSAGFLVLFHPDELRVEMPSLEELTRGLAEVQAYSDGVIYQAAGD